MPKPTQPEIFKTLIEDHKKIETALIQKMARDHLDLIRIRSNIAFFERHRPLSAVQRCPEPAAINLATQILDLDVQRRVGIEPHVQKMVDECGAHDIGKVIVGEPLSDDGEHQFLACLDGRMR